MSKVGKILPVEAAMILNMSPQFIRVAMQQDRLPIGTAVKMSSIWTYHISEKLLAEYSGKDIKAELEKIRGNKRKCSKKSLLCHLMQHGHIIIDFLDLVDLLEEGKRTLDNAYKSNGQGEEDIEFLKDNIATWERQYHEIIDGFVKQCPEADIGEQISMVRKYYKEINEFINK